MKNYAIYDGFKRHHNGDYAQVLNNDRLTITEQTDGRYMGTIWRYPDNPEDDGKILGFVGPFSDLDRTKHELAELYNTRYVKLLVPYVPSEVEFSPKSYSTITPDGFEWQLVKTDTGRWVAYRFAPNMPDVSPLASSPCDTQKAALNELRDKIELPTTTAKRLLAGYAAALVLDREQAWLIEHARDLVVILQRMVKL